MPTLLRLQAKNFTDRAARAPARRAPFTVTPDRIQSHGLDLAAALEPQADRARLDGRAAGRRRFRRRRP